MVERLELMAERISKWPYVIHLKAIPTASIPVIKVVSFS